MNAIINLVIGIYIIFLMFQIFLYGIPYSFSSFKIFTESLFSIITLDLLGIWLLKSKPGQSIIKGGLIWKLKRNKAYRISTFILLTFIQLGIFGFAYSSVGSGQMGRAMLVLIIPSLIASALLIS